MDINQKETLVCTKCSNKEFEMKREATYLYTYDMDNHEKWLSKTEILPFLFDNREQIDEKEYLVCKKCGSVYPCSLDKVSKEIELTILRKAVRADHQENPEFLG